MIAAGVTLAPFEPALLPGLVACWNAAFADRRNFSPVDEAGFRLRVVEQAAFDPAGLILALAGSTVCGFVHALRPAPPQVSVYRNRRCRKNGSIAALAVTPGRRGQGIGSSLLARAEGYLAAHLPPGAVIYAGEYDLPLYGVLEGPRQPFWGDTEMMGIAEDDAALIGFLARRGYRPAERDGQEITMTAGLAGRPEPVSPPLEAYGLREVSVSEREPWRGRIGWYPEDAPDGYRHAAFGTYRHEVIALARGDTIVAHAEWYRMRRAGWAALHDIGVPEADRGRGLGAYLLDKVLWAMARNGARQVELHTHTVKNAQAVEMYLRRGFSIVERWVTLQK